MIFSVLKVIGIIILIILAILIVIAGIILFVPVRYSFQLSKDEKLECDVLVKWNPVLLKVMGRYHEDTLEYRVKLFGGLVMTNTEDKLSWFGRRFFSGRDDKNMQSVKEKAEKETEENKDISNNTQSKSAEDHTVCNTQEDKKEEKETADKNSETDIEKSNNRAKKEKKVRKNLFKEFKEKWNSLTETVKKISSKKEALKKVYYSPIFGKVKEDLKGYIKEIFKIIKPKELSGYVEFGLDDPAATGEILGALAMILPLYDGFFTVKPDFTEKFLKGNMHGKGKIYLISVLKLLIKVIFNKNLIKVKKKVQTILES